MAKDIWIKCPGCDYGTIRTYDLRRHYANMHPQLHPYDLELHIVEMNNPELDIGLLLVRYLDHQETIVGLQMQGIYVKKFLHVIGVARSLRHDMALMGRLKRFKMGKQKEFETSLVRTRTWLRKAGVEEELADVVTALKVIKYVKKQLEQAKEPEKPKEPEERLIGRYTALYASIRAGTA